MSFISAALDSLQRLLHDYKQPLVDASPPILSENKARETYGFYFCYTKS